MTLQIADRLEQVREKEVEALDVFKCVASSLVVIAISASWDGETTWPDICLPHRTDLLPS